ncbi:unnamed protein product [Mytilus edulis]|uniref:Tyr recombinase domain-containing protein n=1 Tax=Mytilus edulis TaxID=6550 RepID=A0A8S3S475_MYTED|nr:unnamed protein product [Mytilus edulis]
MNAPKMYEYPGDRNSLAFYDLYASKRPSEYSAPDSPFYIAPRTIPLDDKRSDKWYIKQKIGERKLSNIMKIMKEKGDLNKDKRLTNHSARKYLVQKLCKNDIQNTDIMQISGHKSVTSVNNYSSMDEDKHRKISNILSNPTENVQNVADLSILLPVLLSLPYLNYMFRL